MPHSIFLFKHVLKVVCMFHVWYLMVLIMQVTPAIICGRNIVWVSVLRKFANWRAVVYRYFFRFDCQLVVCLFVLSLLVSVLKTTWILSKVFFLVSFCLLNWYLGIILDGAILPQHQYWRLITFRLKQYGHHFADNNFYIVIEISIHKSIFAILCESFIEEVCWNSDARK